jgi:diguanylate cyclase (GGDEF)-like protein/PAS domain S-box-containing protein
VKKATRLAFRLAVVYAAFGALWITLSDVLLATVAPDISSYSHYQTYKGWLYVFITATLVFYLMQRGLRQQALIQEELRKSEERWHFALEGAGDGVWDLDVPSGRIIFSQRWHEIFGYGEHEFGDDYQAWADHLHPEDRESTLAAVQDCLEGKQGQHSIEFRLRCKDGSWKWVLGRGKVVSRNQLGKPLRMVGTVTDITERKRTEESLRESEERYRSLFDHTLEGIAHCRMLYERDQPADFIYLDVNSAFTRLTGLHDVAGKRASEVIPGIQDSNPELFNIYGRVAAGGPPEKFETYVSGLGIWFAVTAYQAGPGCFIAVFDNITQRKQDEARLDFLAYHDLLTGLPNREMARDHFKLALAYAERNAGKVALLFLDLDRFKNINDSLGHTVGDVLLKEVARRLQECVRMTDTLSRQGGDEFVILLSDIKDVNAVTAVADKILERLSLPFSVEQHMLAISVSIGVALYPDDGKDFDSLLRKADTAMYQAKESGRNTCYFFDQQMNIDADERLHISNSLRRALEQHELVLHYQPMIEISDNGRLVGAEALLRWNHPQQGLIMPDRFIPVAEDNGLIIPIGAWVLYEACRQMAAWHAAGFAEMVVAVNLSALQFKRGDLEQTIVDALSKTGLEPQYLELELTESILIADAENVLQKVQHLKNMGLKLSVDDFGTGYSSFAYLKRFAVDKLKIDQSFVRGIDTDHNDAAIVRAIIQMARSLNLRTIAEGVEDQAKLKHLKLYHCDEAQGYHIGKPMPAAEFASFLSAGAHRPQ